MVKYFELNSIYRLLPNIKGRMNCFICDKPGIHKVNISTIERDVLLCEYHYRLYGDIDLTPASGPVLQNM